MPGAPALPVCPLVGARIDRLLHPCAAIPPAFRPCRGAAGGVPYRVRRDGQRSRFPQPITVSLPWFWLCHRAPWQWWSGSGVLAPERPLVFPSMHPRT